MEILYDCKKNAFASSIAGYLRVPTSRYRRRVTKYIRKYHRPWTLALCYACGPE